VFRRLGERFALFCILFSKRKSCCCFVSKRISNERTNEKPSGEKLSRAREKRESVEKHNKRERERVKNSNGALSLSLLLLRFLFSRRPFFLTIERSKNKNPNRRRRRSSSSVFITLCRLRATREYHRTRAVLSVCYVCIHHRTKERRRRRQKEKRERERAF